MQLTNSRLTQLPTGQLIGYPVTRRALKRQLRQARLTRRAEYRILRRSGLSYELADIRRKAA